MIQRVAIAARLIVRNYWFKMRFGYDRRAKLVRSRRWWRIVRALHLAPRVRRCERCSKPNATKRTAVWSHDHQRWVYFCAECLSYFELANSNRAFRRALVKRGRKR